MKFVEIPVALEERLGEAAAVALADVLDASHRACVENVMAQCSERFERRLVEETSKLRVEMARTGSELRSEMHAGFAALRMELAAGRFELLKWAFVFWVGQVISVVGIVALLLHARP